jgi:hypothetical protein
MTESSVPGAVSEPRCRFCDGAGMVTDEDGTTPCAGCNGTGRVFDGPGNVISNRAGGAVGEREEPLDVERLRALEAFSMRVGDGAKVILWRGGEEQDAGLIADQYARLSVNEGGVAPKTYSERFCERCGGPNLRWWHAPSPLWNTVMRDTEGREKFGIVCPRCFGELAQEKGVADFFCLTTHDPKVPLPTVFGDGRVWDAEQCMWVAPPAKWDHLDDGTDPEGKAAAEKYVESIEGVAPVEPQEPR